MAIAAHRLSQLLRVGTRGVASTVRSKQVPLVRLTRDGTISRESWSLQDIKHRSRLHPRDIVAALDLGNDLAHYRLLPRRRCIVFALSNIKGIVYSDEVHIWLPQNADAPDTPKRLELVMHLVSQVQQRVKNVFGSENGQEGGKGGVSDGDSSSVMLNASIADAIGSESGEGLEAKFEFVVLDQLLHATHERHRRRLAFCKPLVLNALSGLDAEPDRLYTLYPLRNTLEHFQSAASDVVGCLKEVLENDRDMREVCLTDKKTAFADTHQQDAATSGTEGSQPRRAKKTHRHGHGEGPSRGGHFVEAGSPAVVLGKVSEETLLDLEVMLETHMRVAADVRQQTQQLLRHMDTRQAILNSTLDAYRNHLIDVSLRMNIIGLGVSFGTLASGLFGMNLYNGMEDIQSTTPFLTVTATCLLGTALTYTIVRDWTVLSSPAGRHTARVRKFVSRIGLTAPKPAVSILAPLLNSTASATRPLVVAASGSGENGEQHLRLTREQFASLYEQVTDTRIPPESVDIVYAIFDADQDGALAMDEVLGMMNEDGRIDDRALEALAQMSGSEHSSSMTSGRV